MPSEPKRKLVAIMFTDMVGYTALMQEDEDKARELIQRHRALMKPLVEKHGGEIIQYVGDGTFCRFESAKEAVNSALEIQYVLKVEKELALRIGIHIGDVVVEGEEVYGDGVNVASRIEPLAEAGGICVSHQVYENIKNQSGLSLSSLGKKDLKNVDDEMEVFTVTKSSEPTAVTSDIPKPTSASNKFNMKWIGVAVLITALVIVGLKIDFGTVEVESRKDLNNLRIAVLPFTNMSEDASNEFFADGITDDILTQLSKIKSLEVISRTSIMQYKNTTKNLSEIGAELGVATILEGSVRRGGNRVRINAQLIDVNTDKHLWAETYDRDLDDIFAIQSDVAKKIAAALEASLSPEEEDRINEKPTNNLEAYDFYLKGNILYEKFGHDYERELLEESIASYEKAVALDSNFIIAYSRLARAHLAMYWDGFGTWDRTDERLAKAKKAIDKASGIDPEHPEVQIAKGYYYYWGYRDYDEALNYLIPTLEKQPNNSDVSVVIGYVYRRMGKWDDAIASLKRAADLDPRSYNKIYALAQTYTAIRKWKEAERYSNRLILLQPESVFSYYPLIFSLPRGNLEEKRIILNAAMENIDPNKIVLQQGLQYEVERNFTKALNVFESDTAKWYGNKAFLHFKLGHTEKAYSYYDSMRVETEDKLTEDPKNDWALSKLGLAYAGLGRKEEAIEKGLEAVELLPLSKDAFFGTFRIERLAQIYTMVGEYDKAIDQLVLLLSIPGFITEHSLKLDPIWDPLREHPRFIRLIAN
ncbi:tetratricopeptide repeat protein [Candidatus Marinimicrobia bacterium MT.SAG.3]|nr:tetratricopeptide repeat protein [Candidatus Marinimicrobia bacterium MT.SAG.3]